MKFITLINVKMSTIVCILTFISMVNTTSESLKAKKAILFSILVFMSEWLLTSAFMPMVTLKKVNSCHTENEPLKRKQVFWASDLEVIKVSKGAKIRNRFNQVPHLIQDTNGKVTNSQLDTTNESQEVSPFPAGDHKVHINRHPQRHSKHKTDKNIKDPQKKYRLGTVSKIFYWRA